MNPKLLFKTLFLIVVALLLVLMGMHNKDRVELTLPPLLSSFEQPAAIMYIGFFALGFLSGAIMNMGGKKGGKSKSD
jgi:uncharacterized integral membrane protein